jgi:hypothetical protein
MTGTWKGNQARWTSASPTATARSAASGRLTDAARPLHRPRRRRGGRSRRPGRRQRLNWRYTLALPVDGRVCEVQFDDWMYLVDERVMLNKAVMSKFGIRLGEVTCPSTKP